MIDLIIAKINDPQFVVSVLVAIAAVATVLTLAMPLLETDTLSRRMKSVGAERERIRARERERLAKTSSKPNLRQEPKAYMKQVVEMFNLSKSARYGRSEEAARHGRLSRRAGGDCFPLLPSGHANSSVRRYHRSTFSSSYRSIIRCR